MRSTRNENGYGTVVCLDKTGLKRKKPWAVRVTIGWNEGKQKTKYIGYYEKRKEAERALAEFNAKNMHYNANTVTFDDIFQIWHERNVGKMTPEHIARYASIYRLIPDLHRKKLKDVKYRDLQSAMDKIDRKFSSKSKVKSLMKQLYEIAIVEDLAIKDYSKLVDIKCKQEESGNVYTAEEITFLWNLEGKKEIFEDILILIYTGMRIGEAVEISPIEDFHLEDGYFNCHGTKTESSDRVIPIHPSILPILEKRKDRKWLFLNSRGEKALYRTFAYTYTKLMNELEWNHTIHDTRKTFATILHENDITESDIKAILGHSQVGVTNRVYIKHRIERLVSVIKTVTFV